MKNLQYSKTRIWSEFFRPFQGRAQECTCFALSNNFSSGPTLSPRLQIVLQYMSLDSAGLGGRWEGGYPIKNNNYDNMRYSS